MSLIASKSLLSLTVIFILLISSTQAGWQGAGTMSSSNITDIWAYINANISKHSYNDFQGGSYQPFAVGLSANLNGLWNQAWNVITIVSSSNSDSIVYGYAYKNHWLWYNNFVNGADNLAFVLWKDYNCKVWQAVGDSVTGTGFTSLQTTQIANVIPTVFKANTEDIWGMAYEFVTILTTTKSEFSTGAYTIVASQDYLVTHYFGYVCAAATNSSYYSYTDYNGGNALSQNDGNGNMWGTLLLIKMR